MPKAQLATSIAQERPQNAGENWLLASWRTTMVIVNTSPVNVIIDTAIVVRICCALVGPPLVGEPRGAVRVAEYERSQR